MLPSLFFSYRSPQCAQIGKHSGVSNSSDLYQHHLNHHHIPQPPEKT